MAKGKEIIDYKNMVISSMAKSDDIIKLIDPEYVGEGDALINKRFFPFFRVPGTEEETLTYVCCEMEASANLQKDSLRSVSFDVYAMSHQDIMLTPEGTVIDLLGWRIEEIFTDSTVIGIGKIKLLSSKEYALGFRHRYRLLKFSTLDSDISCGG